MLPAALLGVRMFIVSWTFATNSSTSMKSFRCGSGLLTLRALRALVNSLPVGPARSLMRALCVSLRTLSPTSLRVAITAAQL